MIIRRKLILYLPLLFLFSLTLQVLSIVANKGNVPDHFRRP